MSIYSVNDSGTSHFHSRFKKSISNKIRFNCGFHELIPVLKRFCLPGDVWRIKGQCLVRFLPMVSPSMTPYELITRYFFVPLRQVESNTELIITGSRDGKLYENELPKFANFTEECDKATYVNAYKVPKYGFWDYMNVPVGDYESIKDDKCLPAAYWAKGYFKIWADYYRDENYGTTQDEYDNLIVVLEKYLPNVGVFHSNLKKDYFTSALPWQLKGTAPVLDVTGNWDPQFDLEVFYGGSTTGNSPLTHRGYDNSDMSGMPLFNLTGFASGATDEHKTAVADAYNEQLNAQLNKRQVFPAGIGFNADELRVMMAQTRIFERLARCGSRYTEYLWSNFGTAPADETLQRPKYLGGWKIPIVTSEVLQTAEDGTTPVGTMRGHGISRGGNGIKDFYCKEFGLLFGIVEVRPKVEYTQGIPRQLTYKERFDFFNPSFQHLSEQEVRNGELFVSFSDNKNDETLGFQAYANELRSSQDEVVADMRDALSYWGSSLHFTSRPNVKGLITATNHNASFNAPFVDDSSSAKNIIISFYNDLDVYRPMVRYATPGLVDHF